MIEERQKVDKLAKETSVVEIGKIVNEYHYYQKPWYESYWIKYPGYVMTTNYIDSITSDTTSGTTFSDSNSSFNCSGTDFHSYFAGSYQVYDKIINI